MKKLVMFETEMSRGEESRYKQWLVSELLIVPGTLSITDAPNLRIERRETGGFAIHPFGGGDPYDADVDIYDGNITWASLGHRTPADARAFAFALLEAAKIVEQMFEASTTPAHERTE